MAPLFEEDTAAPHAQTAGLLRHGAKVKLLSQNITKKSGFPQACGKSIPSSLQDPQS